MVGYDILQILKNQVGNGELLNDKMISYDIFADKGQKGGLVWTQLDGRIYAIGVHT